MFSWFKDKVRKARDGTKKIAGILWTPASRGLALITSRGGSGAFNGFHFAGRLYGVEDGSKTKLGIALATFNFVSAFGSNIFTRFFNICRPGSEPDLSPPADIKVRIKNSNQILSLKDHEEPGTCCHPGTETYSWSPGYILSQLSSGHYVIGSGLSAIQSMTSLILLLQVLAEFQYDGSCKEETDWLKFSLVNLASAFLIGTNVESFLKYNLLRLKEYYKKFFLETRLFKQDGTLYAEYELENNKLTPITLSLGTADLYSRDGKLYRRHDDNDDSRLQRIFDYDGDIIDPAGNTLTLHRGIWELSFSDHFQVFVGTSLGSIGVFFANQRLVNTINETILCHFIRLSGGTPSDISEQLIKTLAYASAATNLTTNGLLTAGGKLNIREKNRLAAELGYTRNPETRPVPNTKAKNPLRQLLEKSTQSMQETIQSIKSTLSNPLASGEHSEFGKLYFFIQLFILGNSLNIAQGTYAAVTDLPRSIADRSDLVNHPGIIFFGIITAAIAFLNQRTLDIDSVIREEKERKKEREHRLRFFTPVDDRRSDLSLLSHRSDGSVSDRSFLSARSSSPADSDLSNIELTTPVVGDDNSLPLLSQQR